MEKSEKIKCLNPNSVAAPCNTSRKLRTVIKILKLTNKISEDGKTHSFQKWG